MEIMGRVPTAPRVTLPSLDCKTMQNEQPNICLSPGTLGESFELCLFRAKKKLFLEVGKKCKTYLQPDFPI